MIQIVPLKLLTVLGVIALQRSTRLIIESNIGLVTRLIYGYDTISTL